MISVVGMFQDHACSSLHHVLACLACDGKAYCLSGLSTDPEPYNGPFFHVQIGEMWRGRPISMLGYPEALSKEPPFDPLSTPAMTQGIIASLGIHVVAADYSGGESFMHNFISPICEK